VTYLIDSDTVNYIVKEIEPVPERYYRASDAGAHFILSVVVDYEVTLYLRLKGFEKQLRFYNVLTHGWEMQAVSDDDWARANKLWVEQSRVGKPPGDADLLIAVTAFRTGATLVTNNVKDFEGLGVAVENWAAP
jgi:predicted nucleic acid-binding protein